MSAVLPQMVKPNEVPKSQSWSLHRISLNMCAKRLTFLAISVGCILLLSGLARLGHDIATNGPRWQVLEGGPPLPPLYSEFREYERTLPQHDVMLPFPEGRHGRYLWISNHVQGSGWGNVLQEQILHAYLTERTGRGFVYNNYTWNSNGSDYSDYNGKLIPSRIPTTALIQGPIVGTRLGPDPKLPRAIMKEYWDHICPAPTIVRTEDILDGTGVRWKNGSMITEVMVHYLAKIEDRCVEITSWPIYDFWILGDPARLLDIWPTLSTSPVVTEFGWSSLVEIAFEMNRQLISPLATYEEFPKPSRLAKDRYPEIPGLLVMHIRRGDFEKHCIHLKTYGSNWLAFNAIPGLPDKYSAPSDTGSDENAEYYQHHCYPNISQIIMRVDAVRVESAVAGKDLHDVYIMTNGPGAWIDELKVALFETGHWKHVSSSRDVHLLREQKYIAQAVDMLIGQRAAVFIGNGWSSLSGIVTMMRMASGIDPSYTRYL